MKTTIFKPGVFSLFFIALLMYLSCNKQNYIDVVPLQKISACGVNDPLNELTWLNELVIQSNTDKSGNYIGNIWIKNYQDKDIIVTDMSLGSGNNYFETDIGLRYTFFNDKTLSVRNNSAY